jgi:hypothetical protein
VLRLHRGCLVTKPEHQRLGSMRNDYPDLLIRAVLCPPDEVVDVCLERYARAGIRVRLLEPDDRHAPGG